MLCCFNPILNTLLHLFFPKYIPASLLSWRPYCFSPILNASLLPILSWIPWFFYSYPKIFLLLSYAEFLAASVPILNLLLFVFLSWIPCCFSPVLNTLLLLSHLEKPCCFYPILNTLLLLFLSWTPCCFYPILKTLLRISYPEYLTYPECLAASVPS